MTATKPAKPKRSERGSDHTHLPPSSSYPAREERDGPAPAQEQSQSQPEPELRRQTIPFSSLSSSSLPPSSSVSHDELLPTSSPGQLVPTTSPLPDSTDPEPVPDRRTVPREAAATAEAERRDAVLRQLGLPTDPLPGLDWDELAGRFGRIGEQKREEQARLVAEFESLSKIFAAWAEAGTKQDSSRGYKRLKTRMFHVQASEEACEARRMHYVKVVSAFQDAFRLLGDIA